MTKLPLAFVLIAACDHAPSTMEHSAGHRHPQASFDLAPAQPATAPALAAHDAAPAPVPAPARDPEPDPVIDPVVTPAITTFPYVDTNNTNTGTSEIHNYGCAPGTDESGPEIRYRLTITTPGLLVASLDGLDPGVDVDVHILSSTTCLERGHWDAATFVDPGDYQVVVDSWVDAQHVAHAGAYTVTIGFTAIAAFEQDGLDADVLDAGLHAFASAWQADETDRLEYTVIDFSLHSIHPRLWTIDLHTGDLMFVQQVSHGEGSANASDRGWATDFSNVDGSHMSSLGLMRTATRYVGENGASLRLDGLEPGINDAVRARAIVIHSADYATPAYAAAHDRMGLSWGCQVVDPAVIDALVDAIAGGALVWSWYPDDAWLASSPFLDGWTPRE